MVTNQKRTPPNGWHFPAAQGVELKGTDKKTLIDAVYEFRIRNGGNLETIEREIDNYYCTTWPTACDKEPSDYGAENRRRTGGYDEALLHRVSRWGAGMADKMPRGGYQLVSQDEASRRQLICVGCPHNVSWRTGCTGCSGSTAQLMMQVRGLRKSNPEALGCKINGFDCGTASNLPLDILNLSDEQKRRLPERCWAK